MQRLTRLVGDSLPPAAQRHARRALTTFRSRGLRPADIVLASFPKSGSTWVRFVLSYALSGREVDFDVVAEVSPPLGRHRRAPRVVPGGGRLVKSHELPRFVGTRRNHPRVLCLTRDGRDIAVSYYYQLVRRGRIEEDFATYFDAFIAGETGSFGSWQDWCRAWLDYAKVGNSVVFLQYEQLLAAPESALAEVSDKLGLALDPAVIAEALRRNTPSEMRAKEAVSSRMSERSVKDGIPFVGEAKAGRWRDVLDPGLCARFESVAGRELEELGYPPAGTTSARQGP